MNSLGDNKNYLLNENKSFYNTKINKIENKDDNLKIKFEEIDKSPKNELKSKINKKAQKTIEINPLNNSKKSNKENNISKKINKKQALEINNNNNDKENINTKQNNNLKIEKEKEKFNKNDNSKSSEIIIDKENSIFEEEKKNSELLNFKLKKNKKVYKPKIEYTKILSFIDEKDNIKEFKLYKDSDIGFGEQYKIKHLFQDNDVDSDERSIKHGFITSLRNISEAIKLMKNKDKKFVGKYLEYIEK